MKRLARSTAWTEAKLFSYGSLLVWESMHQFCDKTSFHGLGRCQDLACWHACVSNSHLCIYGKMRQKPPCIPGCAQPISSVTRVSNPTARLVSAIRLHVKSRDGKEWKAAGEKKRRRNKTEETADISDICSRFSLHVRFFFFFFSLSQQDGRRGGGGGDKSAYQNERLQQFPYYSYCNHFNPSPICAPGCVDTAKRRDASYCMTN